MYIGRDAPRRGMFELSGGGMFASGFDLGESDRRADPELTHREVRSLFERGTVAGFPGAFARIGFYLSDSVSIEGGDALRAPDALGPAVRRCRVGAPNATAEETLSHYLFEGSLVWHLRHLSFASGRAIPYVAGGAGYLRELHEGNQLVETGQEFHALGGLKYWLGSRRPAVRRCASRAGVSSRKKGFDTDDEAAHAAGCVRRVVVFVLSLKSGGG